MSAGNCIYIGDYNEPDVYNAKLRRARKPRVCGECGDAIERGDIYEHVTGLWDGRWDKHDTCARCVNVRTDFFRGWLFGQMVEDFMDAHGFDYRDGIPADFAPCGKVAGGDS